jgi:hypothetical protein
VKYLEIIAFIIENNSLNENVLRAKKFSNRACLLVCSSQAFVTAPASYSTRAR